MWARSSGSVLFAVIALGAPLLVIPAAGADGTESDFIAVNEHGASPVEQSDGAMTWTIDASRSS